MRAVLAYFQEREEEFARHLSIARMLDTRVNEVTSEDIRVEVRHVNTIKSGLIIHLYNIVEAISTKILKIVGQTVVTERPGRWTEEILKEWVRAVVWNGEERIGDGVLTRLTRESSRLASGQLLADFIVKGEPGSWDDEAIRKVAKRLGCQLLLSDEIRQAAYETRYRNDTTALQYLAKRRNDIAHGVSTFEEGAHDLTLDELVALADRVLPFLKAVAESYEAFLTQKSYIASGEEIA